MIVTFDIPDTTQCMFLSYIFIKGKDMLMAVDRVDTDDLRSGKTIIVPEYEEKNDETDSTEMQ